MRHRKIVSSDTAKRITSDTADCMSEYIVDRVLSDNAYPLSSHTSDQKLYHLTPSLLTSG
jgi:hypothetical protein